MHALLTIRTLKGAAWIGLAAGVGLLAWNLHQNRGVFMAPASRDAPGQALVPGFPEPPAAAGLPDGTVFRGAIGGPDTVAPPGQLSKRFRLAGTFFGYTESQASTRRAILEDVQNKGQILVTEGDVVDASIRVASIRPDSVVLRDGMQEEELRLSFSGQAGLLSTNAAALSPGQPQGGMRNRFGQQVEERRWLLQREALMRYYQELMENTERLAKLFDSLEPVYKDEKITGYSLNVKGEADAFEAIGLKPGDVVRTVNSMPMTSQRRAEYFIREFVKDRVNAFAVDIERDGKPEKLIYMVR